MAEDTARALGAGNPSRVVMIAGKECYPRPINAVCLTELERICVEAYRRSYIKTYTDNFDLLPESMQDKLIEKKFEEAARMDSKSLPPRTAFDIKKIKLNANLSAWAMNQVDEDTLKDAKKEGDIKVEKLLKIQILVALDSGILTLDSYKEMTGITPNPIMIPYVSWWCSATFEGQLHMVWMSFKPFGVTLEDIKLELGTKPARMAELAHEIEHLTVPTVGNG